LNKSLIITNISFQLAKTPVTIQANPSALSAISRPLMTAKQPPLLRQKGVANSNSGDMGGWDNWPDGVINRDFSWEEFEATQRLMSHWAAKVGGGDRRGDALADEWERGKKSTRNCLGVIVCEDENCNYAVRPLTTRAKLVQQLERNCEICGASLTHEACDVGNGQTASTTSRMEVTVICAHRGFFTFHKASIKSLRN
jgi:hypothetical protein